MMQISQLIAQTETPAPSGIESFFSSGLMLPILLIIMFYFLLIRPQQRQRKEQAKRIAALEKGDKVVTTAGLHGIVHNVKDKTVLVKVAEATSLEFDKAAIASVVKRETKDA